MNGTKTGYAYSYQDQDCVQLHHSQQHSPSTAGSWIIQLKGESLSDSL